MPVICCDTSFLISLYGRDPNTPFAQAESGRLTQPITVTSFNEFELLNAVRLLVFRRVMDAVAASVILNAFAQDLAIGKLIMPPCDFVSVLTKAKRLSATWTLTRGHRALDILHVAAALHLQATEFLSFDHNQGRLAAAESLTVRP